MNCGKAIKPTTSAPPQILEITGFWTLDGRVSTGSLETILEKKPPRRSKFKKKKWLSERMKYNIYASFPFQQTVIPKWKLECHNLTGSFRQEQYWKMLKNYDSQAKSRGNSNEVGHSCFGKKSRNDGLRTSTRHPKSKQLFWKNNNFETEGNWKNEFQNTSQYNRR